MPAGAFNVSRLLASLGHKNVLEMPVRPDIQTVIGLGTMAGQVPAHVAGSVVFGGTQPAVAAELATYEIQSLDPGGLVIQDVTQDFSTLNTVWRVSATPIAWTTGPTPLVPQHFTNSPSLSLARMGASVTGVLGTEPEFRSEWFRQAFAPLVLPRGMNLQFIGVSVNVGLRMNFSCVGIAASEGGE